MTRKKSKRLAFAFLQIEVLLWWLMLTHSGQIVRWSEFASIVLCAAFGAIHIKTGRRWLIFGLLCTLGADFWLVAYQPQQQLWGMVFFLGTQCCYAIALWRRRRNKVLLVLRLLLVLAAEILTVVVLKDKADALALISLAYYAMLIMNIITAFAQWKISKSFPVALALFLLCDTVIGLQVAAAGYLPIGEDSWLYGALFSGFNLAWFFYLPSQVLIALETRRRK